MIKNDFPKERESYKDGTSDGWCYHIDFWADTDEEVLKSVRDFLNEEGYADVPLPTVERLWLDYLKPVNGARYVWHPIIIYASEYKTTALELHIYNESHEEHKTLWADILEI